MANLGSSKYQLIMYAPVLSALYGDSAFGSTTKLGGLLIMQVDDPAAKVATFSDFYSTSGEAYSMASLYGTQGTTIAESALIWASKMHMTLEAPVTNTSGSVIYGSFPFSSLMDRVSKGEELTIN